MVAPCLKDESLVALAAASLLAVGIALLQWPRATGALPTVATAARPLLPGPQVAASRWLGYSNLAADWLWLQYVQYAGDSEARQRTGYTAAANYLEAITSANPRFVWAYAQAHYSVAELMGDPRRGLAILVRGAEANPGRPDALAMPGNWFLWRLAGSVAFRHFENYPLAARFYARAASEPGAPAIMKDNAAAFFAAANDRERALQLWREFYREAPTAYLRERARARLAELGVTLP